MKYTIENSEGKVLTETGWETPTPLKQTYDWYKIKSFATRELATEYVAKLSSKWWDPIYYIIEGKENHET